MSVMGFLDTDIATQIPKSIQVYSRREVANKATRFADFNICSTNNLKLVLFAKIIELLKEFSCVSVH